MRAPMNGAVWVQWKMNMRRKGWSEVANDFGGYVWLGEQVGMIFPGK